MDLSVKRILQNFYRLLADSTKALIFAAAFEKGSERAGLPDLSIR
jgi:hypothetical protein